MNLSLQQLPQHRAPLLPLSQRKILNGHSWGHVTHFDAWSFRRKRCFLTNAYLLICQVQLIILNIFLGDFLHLRGTTEQCEEQRGGLIVGGPVQQVGKPTTQELRQEWAAQRTSDPSSPPPAVSGGLSRDPSWTGCCKYCRQLNTHFPFQTQIRNIYKSTGFS